MKISIDKTTSVMIEGHTAVEDVTNTMSFSFFNDANRKWNDGTITLQDKQFMQNWYIYELTELVKDSFNRNNEYKLYNVGDLATAYHNNDIAVYRKKSMVDKFDKEQLLAWFRVDEFPSVQSVETAGGGLQIIEKSIVNTTIEGIQKARVNYKNYDKDGHFIGGNREEAIIMHYNTNDLSEVKKLTPDSDDSTLKTITVTEIEGRYYQLLKNYLYPFNVLTVDNPTDDATKKQQAQFNLAWELAVDSTGEPLRPYFRVKAGNNASISDKDLLTYTTGNELYIAAYGTCFNKVALLKTKFSEVCIEARDQHGNIIPVKDKACRTLADEQKTAYAQLVCPECDKLPNSPDCIENDDRYDIIFELENYNATNVLIHFKDDASIGGVFLGQTYDINCLLWGVEIRSVTTTRIEKDERTGAISRVEGISKRLINFPLHFPTGLTDLHARFFADHISDLVLIEGTPIDGNNPDQQNYFNSLNLFCYIVDAPMILANKSRSSLNLKVEEVLKWD
jgi:hypothetical protein